MVDTTIYSMSAIEANFIYNNMTTKFNVKNLQAIIASVVDMVEFKEREYFCHTVDDELRYKSDRLRINLYTLPNTSEENNNHTVCSFGTLFVDLEKLTLKLVKKYTNYSIVYSTYFDDKETLIEYLLIGCMGNQYSKIEYSLNVPDAKIIGYDHYDTDQWEKTLQYDVMELTVSNLNIETWFENDTASLIRYISFSIPTTETHTYVIFNGSFCRLERQEDGMLILSQRS